MDAHIYLVTNIANGKQYVGQTATSSNKLGHGKVLRQAYKKYGFDGFTYDQVVAGITNRNTLNCLERFWIATFDTIMPNGYNLESGGSEGQIWTDERRAKHSAARVGKPLNRPLGSRSGMKGKVYPEFGKLKLSLAMMGNKHSLGVFPSEETKAKMSASQKAKAASFEVHPNAGKTASAETKAKMSASHKKQVQSDAIKLKRSESIKAWHKQRKEKSWL